MPDCVFIPMKRKRSVNGHDCLKHRLLGNVNNTSTYVFGVLDCASDTLAVLVYRLNLLDVSK